MENVITLEMADFEKTVERLQKELKEVNLAKTSLISELEASMKEMDNIREEKGRLNDNIAELNVVLKKLKEEMEGRFFQSLVKCDFSRLYSACVNLFRKQRWLFLSLSLIHFRKKSGTCFT